MNKLLIIMVILGLFGACSSVEPGQDMVITDPVYLKEGVTTTPTPGQDQEAFLVDKEALELPEALDKILDEIFPNIDVVAVTQSKHLKEDTPVTSILQLQPKGYANEDGTTSTDWGSLVGTVGQVIPPAAPYLPLLGLLISLLRKRSRGHLTDAVVALTPGLGGGGTQWGESVKSFSKAVGWDHTEDNAEELLGALVKVAAKDGKAVAIEDGKPFLKELV